MASSVGIPKLILNGDFLLSNLGSQSIREPFGSLFP